MTTSHGIRHKRRKFPITLAPRFHRNFTNITPPSAKRLQEQTAADTDDAQEPEQQQKLHQLRFSRYQQSA